MKEIKNDNTNDFDLNNNDTAKEENVFEETGTGYFDSFGKKNTEINDDISGEDPVFTAEWEFEKEAQQEISPEEETDDEDVPAEDVPAEDNINGEDEPVDFARLSKKRRVRAKIGYAFVALVLILVGTAYGFVNAMFDKIEPDTPDDPNVEVVGPDLPAVEPTYSEDDIELFNAVVTAGSLNDYVSKWYDAGEAMRSKNVINVMLFGLDGYNALNKGGRSDTMMLVSLNTKTKKIKMISFFRDTWAKYYSGEGREFYGKINGAYYYGGAKAAVEPVERMFKIKIDHYVTVDFNAFKDIVDAVGGVRVDVMEYEARNIMREWKIQCPSGENVLLSGEQAFWFARQRHSDADADVSRTRRQRQVIKAFIDSCKDAKISQLNDALNAVFGYVRTDLTKNEIMGYATKALTYGWINYEIETVTLSDPEIFKTPTINHTSIVVQDYPKVAQLVQNEIYGNTNVVLEDNRVIVFNLY